MSFGYPVFLSLLCLVAAPPPHGEAQVTQYFRALDGRLFHAWHNGYGHLTGDTLEIRVMVTNVGDTVLGAGSLPCDAPLITQLALEVLDRECSPLQELAPADSMWIAIVGLIASPPGDYGYTVELAGWRASSTVSILEEPSERDAGRARPGERIFFLVDLSVQEEADVTRQDVETVVIKAISEGSMYLVPAPLSPRAARSLTGFAPYLHIGLHRYRDGWTLLTHCWIRERAREGCSEVWTQEDPFHLGVTIYQLVQRALDRRSPSR